MDYSRMVVFGDSILWGQGLREDHKIASGVQARLESQQGHHVDLVSFAHSGADVWNDGESKADHLDPFPGPLAPLGGVPPEAERRLTDPSPDPQERQRVGELPRAQPYSLREIDRAACELEGSPVDLILLDAGINDVNISHIVLPYMSRQHLDVRTLSVASRLRVLLELAHETFPTARIVVTGYYRLVTRYTDVDRLIRYAARYVQNAPLSWRRLAKVSAFEAPLNAAAQALERHGRLEDSELGTILRNALLAPWKERMVELSAIFADEVHGVIRAEVAKFNLRYGDLAAAAIPTIPDEHAILTAEPWIWGLDDHLQPEDEVAEQRKAVVVVENPPLFERFVWDRASVGHPNVTGAQAFVKAIMPVLS